MIGKVKNLHLYRQICWEGDKLQAGSHQTGAWPQMVTLSCSIIPMRPVAWELIFPRLQNCYDFSTLLKVKYTNYFTPSTICNKLAVIGAESHPWRITAAQLLPKPMFSGRCNLFGDFACALKFEGVWSMFGITCWQEGRLKRKFGSKGLLSQN